MSSDPAAIARLPVAEAGTELAGRYRLLDRIGAGGMGAVWEAEDLSLARRVAVKLPSAAALQDRQHLERFTREARAAARLSHPNVATVLDHGDDDGMPFLVLELLRGETLAARIERGPIPVDEAVQIAGDVAAALDAAHAAGVVHRDVKPANIMLGDTGVKVMDFGAAAMESAPAITTIGIIGTAAYLSPEQAAGEPAEPASDVYSLGIVVYEMLAGRPPFAAESAVATVAAHLHRDPPPLRELAPGTPEHVVLAVERALAKDASLRPPTASAFALALRDPEAAVAGGHHPADADTQVIAAASPSPTEVLAPMAAPARGRDRPGGPAGPRRPAWVAWAAGAAAIVALGLAVWAIGGTDGRGDLPGATTTETTVAAVADVEVPDVLDQPLQAAVGMLEEAGLVIGDVVLAEGPADTVIGVDPGAGASVARGTVVTLTVGAGVDGGGDDGGDDDDDGNGNGRPSCDTDPDHPSCN